MSFCTTQRPCSRCLTPTTISVQRFVSDQSASGGCCPRASRFTRQCNCATPLRKQGTSADQSHIYAPVGRIHIRGLGQSGAECSNRCQARYLHNPPQPDCQSFGAVVYARRSKFAAIITWMVRSLIATPTGCFGDLRRLFDAAQARAAGPIYCGVGSAQP